MVAKITIGLTTYRRKTFLKQAIKSILSQNYKNFELLIGNDYPSKKITLKDLGFNRDSRIKIINHKKNLGEVENLNYLLKKCNTEWFTWMADDDQFHQNYLSILINHLESNKNYNRKLRKLLTPISFWGVL